MRPASNYKSEVDGITVYETPRRDGVYYVPKLVATRLQEQEIGNVKHILQGNVTYGLPQADLDTLKRQFPNHVIAAITPQSYTTLDPLEGKFKGHEVNVRSLSQYPLPQIIFSATLEKNAPDYQEVLEAIRYRWSDGTLLLGALLLSAAMCEIAVKFTVVARYADVKSARETNLPKERISELKIAEFVQELISQGVVGGESEIGKEADVLRQQYILDTIRADHFVASINGDEMDNGTRVHLWDQATVRGGGLDHDFVGIQTSDTLEEIFV